MDTVICNCDIKIVCMSVLMRQNWDGINQALDLLWQRANVDTSALKSRYGGQITASMALFI